MKILKTILILLVPVMGLLSCEKTTCKPNEPASTSNSSNTSNGDVSGKFGESASNGGTTDLVGSGDDDRDGGDKKPKKTR